MHEWNRQTVAHFLNLLIVIELLSWNKKERQNVVGHVRFEPIRVSVGIELYLYIKTRANKV